MRQKVTEIESAHDNHKYGLSWQLINDISGRKATQSKRIKGENSEKRVEAWYHHFKSLLGSPPDLLVDDGPIPPIFINLPIDESPFTLAEYRNAKASLKYDRSCGEDGGDAGGSETCYS